MTCRERSLYPDAPFPTIAARQKGQHMTRQEAGRKGGLATLAKHGKEHMQEIGRKGFAATREKRFDGCTISLVKWLYRRKDFTPTKIPTLANGMLVARDFSFANVSTVLLCEIDNSNFSKPEDW